MRDSLLNFMRDSPNVMLIVSVGFFLIGCYQFYIEIKELSFYRRNDWDFKRKSGIGGDLYQRNSADSRMSNKGRVLFGRPLLTFVFFFMAVGIFFGAISRAIGS
jgi:hypothetical protein